MLEAEFHQARRKLSRREQLMIDAAVQTRRLKENPAFCIASEKRDALEHYRKQQAAT
jgi:hypothetical protein